MIKLVPPRRQFKTLEALGSKLKNFTDTLNGFLPSKISVIHEMLYFQTFLCSCQGSLPNTTILSQAWSEFSGLSTLLSMKGR